jgi:hypothetical protein
MVYYQKYKFCAALQVMGALFTRKYTLINEKTSDITEAQSQDIGHKHFALLK